MHVLLSKVIQMVTRLNQTDCKETNTDIMAIGVVGFSREGYKIRKDFA